MRRISVIVAAAFVLSPLLVPGAYAQLGSVTLKWSNPTENEDGSVLTDLTYIDVYQARNSVGPYSRARSVGMAPLQTQTILIGLYNGHYWYQVRAVNSFGVESAPSNTADIEINLGGNGAPAPNPPLSLVAS